MAIPTSFAETRNSILLGPQWRWRYATGSPWTLNRFGNPHLVYAFIGKAPGPDYGMMYRIKCLTEGGLGMELLDDCIPELEDAMQVAETLIMFRFKGV